MRVGDKSQELRAIALFILVEIGTPIPWEMIAAIAEVDKYKIGQVLNDWMDSLKNQNIQGERCYSIDRASFFDFLKAKRELNST